MEKITPSVPERLKSLGSIFEDRAKVYGDNYKHFGKVMIGLFPRGISLMNEQEFMRFGLFVQLASKLSRYSQSFETGHSDSLDDLAVYSQMLREVDAEIEEIGSIGNTLDDGADLTDPDWLPWDGSSIFGPVMPDVVVKVRFRDGTESSISVSSDKWEWDHRNLPEDIVAYKVVTK